MEHLYTRTCFIDQKIYTTASGIVTTDFKDLLDHLALKAKNRVVDILCDELPIHDVINFLSYYTVRYLLNNASFTFRSIPVEMIENQEILLCKAQYTDYTEKIHQIGFYYKDIYYRFGVSV